MMRRWLFMAALLAAASVFPAAAAPHTRADAVFLVNQAAAFAQSHSREAALAAFCDAQGPFRDGDLYLYVLDAKDPDLMMLAHGANPGLIGVPQIDIVDADGKAFNAETIAVIKSAGSGWVSYRWPNPTTKKIAAKSSYVRLVGDLIIGAGVYE